MGALNFWKASAAEWLHQYFQPHPSSDIGLDTALETVMCPSIEDHQEDAGSSASSSGQENVAFVAANSNLAQGEEMVAKRENTFHHFPDLPVEIRAHIWRTALEPHILRWIRTTDEGDAASNIFKSPSRTSPLLDVCQESRETAILYGSYTQIETATRRIWFSPLIDYLFLDARWTILSRPELLPKDPLDSLPFNLKDIRKLMIHPNYTDSRLRPGIPLERMTSLERILIAADEKSIGVNSKFMLASVYDLKKYYERVKINAPATLIPYIAVGCLCWVGDEKGKLHHREEDSRRLVAVFDSNSEMKEHLNMMREEEMRFLKERFNNRKPGLILHFRSGVSMEDISFEPGAAGSASVGDVPKTPDELPDMSPSLDEVPDGLPTYNQVMSGEDV